jgi:hypothetical protein
MARSAPRALRRRPSRRSEELAVVAERKTDEPGSITDQRPPSAAKWCQGPSAHELGLTIRRVCSRSDLDLERIVRNVNDSSETA